MKPINPQVQENAAEQAGQDHNRQPLSETIKDAHASGDGAMERNDATTVQPASTEKEEPRKPDSSIY